MGVKHNYTLSLRKQLSFVIVAATHCTEEYKHKLCEYILDISTNTIHGYIILNCTNEAYSVQTPVQEVC